MFLKIKEYFIVNKKAIFFIPTILSVFLLSSDTTFALSELDKTSNLAGYIDDGLKLLSMSLAVMTYLTSIFLDPAWINGSLFGLNTYFKQIWILVSNLVYFIFAFILIWIAFMNILGKGQDKYQLKTALPKFVVGILIVPFTWYIVQFTLSISSLLTTAALTLPSQTFPQFENSARKIMLPKACTITLGSKGGSTTSTEGFFFCKKGTDNEISLGKILSGEGGNSGTFGIIASYTYGVLSIDKLDDISIKDIQTKGGIKKIGDLIVKLGMDFIFILIYAILLITLGIALAIRGIYLWIYIIISPVFGLMYFFEKKEGGGEGFIKDFSVTNFVALAMVPVYTMLALSFGLLFIYVIGSGMSKGEANINTDGVSFVKLDKKGVTIGDGGETFRLNIEGSLLGSTDADKNMLSLLSKVGGDGLGVVGTLIIQIFSIVVLWMSVMAALNSSSITRAVTKPIRDFGGQVGGLITKLPTYVPIFPGGQNMQSIKYAANNRISTFESKHGNELGRRFVDDHFGTSEQSRIGKHATSMGLKVSNDNGILDKGSMNEIREYLASAKDIPTLMTSEESKAGFAKTIEAVMGQEIYKSYFNGLKVKDIKGGDINAWAKAIHGLDAIGDDFRDLGSVLKGNRIKAGPVNRTVIESSMKEGYKKEDTTPLVQNTPDPKVEAIKTANFNINNNIDLIIDKDGVGNGVGVTVGGYNASTKEIINKEKFRQSMKDLEIDINQENQFDELMKKMHITDIEKIKEMKRKLEISGTTP